MNKEQKANKIVAAAAEPPKSMETSVENPVEISGSNTGEISGEIGVLKDAAGLGLVIFLIASTQLFSFVLGA